MLIFSKMDLRLLIVAVLNFVTMIRTSTIAKRMCHFGYCNWAVNGQKCYHSHCNADIVCGNGTTIDIIKFQYGAYYQWGDINDCDLVCHGKVMYNRFHNFEIAKLCNRYEKCSLSQWQTDIFWNLEIRYICKAVTVTKTSPEYQSTYSEFTSTSSTDTLTTSTSTTPTTTLDNDSSKTAESKTCNSSSAEKFPVIAVSSSVTAVIVVLVFVVIGVVCIKRRKTTKEKNDSTRVQCNGRQNITLAVSNSVYDETNAADHIAEPREHSVKDYEYATALIAIKPTNENEYNTLNESVKPINADPNYDHIPKQSTSLNETSTTTKEDVYNTFNENTNCKGLNDDPNYEHMSRQSPQNDQTYSHIKSGKYVHNKSKYQVQDVDIYSHLKQ